MAALCDLKEGFDARAERDRAVAIGGAPERDPYIMATVLAQLVLLDAGWQAVNLGPSTALSSMARAIGELRPRLLWLSVSYVDDVSDFVQVYRELYKVAECQGVAVAVGGRALVESVRACWPYTTHGDGMTHLAAFARTLLTRPKPPRRGRPPRS